MKEYATCLAKSIENNVFVQAQLEECNLDEDNLWIVLRTTGDVDGYCVIDLENDKIEDFKIFEEQDFLIVACSDVMEPIHQWILGYDEWDELQALMGIMQEYGEGACAFIDIFSVDPSVAKECIGRYYYHGFDSVEDIALQELDEHGVPDHIKTHVDLKTLGSSLVDHEVEWNGTTYLFRDW